MGISKVIYKGRTLIDLTEDTVTAGSLENDYFAHGAERHRGPPLRVRGWNPCIPNVYYTNPVKYVFMLTDAEKHSYASWADAADTVEWGE